MFAEKWIFALFDLRQRYIT